MLDGQEYFTNAASFPQTAVLLCEQRPTVQEQNLIRILNFFGIAWKALTVAEMADAPDLPDTGGEFCVLSSASHFIQAIQWTRASHRGVPQWVLQARSVYIYGFQDSDACTTLLRFLTSDSESDIRRLHTSRALVFITRDLPELCGPMAGLHVSIPASDLVIAHIGSVANFEPIFRTNEGELFFRVRFRGVPFYLNLCPRILDLSAPSSNYFDVKTAFCEAVPITMYLALGFRSTHWKSPDTNACLIVDDPVLKHRYGFMNFGEVLQLMDTHNFTTTVAFIPWNWRRTDRRTVAVLQKRSDRFSICVHGCDHTAGEFADRSLPALNGRVTLASQRMNSLHQTTGLPYDRIMVFPQGAFSPEAFYALKINGFVAAVNTEVAPRAAENETTVADLWSTAIMKYSSFPVYTRRYLAHGIENFAFDALLGKPCLIVAHHDVFRNSGSELLDFIAKLNSLNWQLCWRPLGDAISRSVRIGDQGGTNVLKLFATASVLENRSGEPQDFVLTKEESDIAAVRSVTVNQAAVSFLYEAGCLRLTTRVGSRGMAAVRVIYSANMPATATVGSLGYSTKTRVRRYLSEFRDNYLSQSDFLYKNTSKARQLFRRRIGVN